MLGKKKPVQQKETAPPPVLSGLTPYTGTWDFGAAKHLLARTTFGPTYTEIKQAAENGLAATIAQLFAPRPEPDPPIYYDFDNDPNVPLGETWVNTPPTNSVQGISASRSRSLLAWMYGEMLNGGVSIREKMVLFWHNHFVTAGINRIQYSYFYIKAIREQALGNFQILTENMTIDQAMLVYLNGNQNSNQAPNENYARELLELFTIGKGNIVSPGDYTTYTEQDIAEIARALTGWINATPNDPAAIGASFIPQRHDSGTKQLSHRFNNIQIQNAGEDEYKNVIDIIFQQDEVARFISRRLHIWFIGSDIDAVVESEVIEPMAALIRDNNYEIQPALEALFSSEYFFDESRRGCMVNHPIDHLFKMARSLQFAMPSNGITTEYRGWFNMARLNATQEMVLFQHASVAGWKPFYQAPQYYDIWVNSVSLPIREAIVEELVTGYNIGPTDFEFDLLNVVSEFEDPGDPYLLIQDFAKLLFPYPVAQNQLEFLTDYLIQGGPYYLWGNEYSDYVADPTDPMKRGAVVTKLKILVGAMLKMPEFYLI